MSEESWGKERTTLEKLVGARSYFSLIPFVALSMMGYFKAGVISAIVPYYMRKYGEKAKPKDLSKLPLRLIFEGMVTEFNAKEAKRWNTIIQYNITGKSGGKFYVEIKDQKCKLEGGEATNPKLIITASREDWVAIAEDKLEGQKAFMEGKMKVEGDMNDLFRMQEVFQTGR